MKVILIITLCFVYFAMYVALDYQRHSIEELEKDIKKLRKRKNEEFVGILNHIKSCQNYEPATRDTQVRRVVNEAIERYADENRSFETLINQSCEEYIKKN